MTSLIVSYWRRSESQGILQIRIFSPRLVLVSGFLFLVGCLWFLSCCPSPITIVMMSVALNQTKKSLCHFEYWFSRLFGCICLVCFQLVFLTSNFLRIYPLSNSSRSVDRPYQELDRHTLWKNISSSLFGNGVKKFGFLSFWVPL